jgi:hypothetical protein
MGDAARKSEQPELKNKKAKSICEFRLLFLDPKSP